MADRWEELEKRCQNCRECSLCETRTNVVFGDGSRTAEIMFVGEGPGAHEDEQGVPFVGKAGQLLDDMLAIIGLDRTMVYIANIVKCRPPQNRDPLGVEQDACIGYLREQVTLLRPKLIVCLGRIAAMRLIREDFKITREHGQWVKKGGFELMAMYRGAAARSHAAARRLRGPDESARKGPRGVRAHAAAGKAVRMRRKSEACHASLFVSSLTVPSALASRKTASRMQKMPMPSRTVSTSW